ncbi:hypothetical protein [Kribbella rubisoli]|uniref:hypothetical protein n=1 Tax=Kribbella rubisoli TaxID=3075929 RepID=UPI00102B7F50|nr:hypothetical protein [Kribbella rubisoli]
MRRIVPMVWPLVLTAVITGPLLAPGFVVSYDMVFVPDLPVRLDLFGVSAAMPRAVPSDVVVAVLDELGGGQVLNKAVLVAIPLLAGLGVTVLWRELRLGGRLAEAAAATLYVWNPFVAERLRLGAWALLLGYAALPWLVRGAIRLRQGRGWAGFVLAAALCALTASGGVVGLLVGGVVLLWRPGAYSRWPVGVALLLNAPWLVAGITHSGLATDGASVSAFAARDEGYGGTLPTLLTLGGVWNADVVPGSRGEPLGLVLAFAMLLMSLAGVQLWWRRDRFAGALVVPAVVALLIALAGVVAPGLFAQVVQHVPGAGLFRDGQRYLAPLALLESIGFGVAAAWLQAQVKPKLVVGLTAALLPVAALPALAGGAGLHLSHYPGDWPQAKQALTGRFIPWPFEAYRAPSWNGHRAVLDPMPRYFGAQPSIVPDELIVSGRRLGGEDPQAADIANALRNGTDLAPVLLRNGVGWIVVDREAGGPAPDTVIRGLTKRFEGPTIAVYQVAGTPAPERLPIWRTVTVLVAWGIAVLTLLPALASVGQRCYSSVHLIGRGRFSWDR